MQVNPWILTLLGCSVLLFGAWTRLDDLRTFERTVDSTNTALLRIQSEIRLRSALDGYQTSKEGFVVQVESAWFEGGPPRNLLLSGSNRSWIDIDRTGNRSIKHPSNPSVSGTGAGWWYNPANGVVRARVPAQATNRATLELYERVNR